MDTVPSVAIVILNYNGKQWLEKFLPSVVTHSQNFDIIVADNASKDDSVAFLSEQYPNIQLVQLAENYGFAKGYNEALKQIKSDYYVLLNSDIEVTANWVEPVIALMEAQNIAICQPKIKDYYQKDTFEYAGAAGGFIDKYGFPFCRGRIFDTLEKDEGQYNQDVPIFWASGACFFIKSQVFHDLGGFDEFFFAHMEEIDLCWRAKTASYKVYFCHSSTVYHVGGGTLQKNNARKTFLNFRNNLIMLKKNLSSQQLLNIILVKLVLDGVAGIKFFFEGSFKNFWAVIKAHLHFYKYLYLNKRKKSHNLRLSEMYPQSLVWAYFVKKIKTFTNLKFPNSRSLT